MSLKSSEQIEIEKRLKLKQIAVTLENYNRLKQLGHAGDSFNDVVSLLLGEHTAHTTNSL